jgi:hypothetical protein
MHLCETRPDWSACLLDLFRRRQAGLRPGNCSRFERQRLYHGCYGVGRISHARRFPNHSALHLDPLGCLPNSSNAFVLKPGSDGAQAVYCTYLGGSYKDRGQAIALDSHGDAYVTGYTESGNFPTAPAVAIQSQLKSSGLIGGDAFVTKLNATGSALLYSTYLGGIFYDSGNAISVDGAGNAYVAGRRGSESSLTAAAGSGFPIVNAVQSNNQSNYKDAAGGYHVERPLHLLAVAMRSSPRSIPRGRRSSIRLSLGEPIRTMPKGPRWTGSVTPG